MIYKRTEFPQWSWSSSRKATFDECLRKYYYNYYLAHNGWEDGASSESKQSYRLKKLTGLHLLLGGGVHEAAEFTCKFIKEHKSMPGEDILRDKIRDILNKAWKESKNIDLWSASPNKYMMLHEFYYGKKPNEEVINKIKTKLDTAIKNLLTSETLKEILEYDYKIILMEERNTFPLNDTPIYAIPDLVLEKYDKTMIVVDWKTGKEHNAHSQQINVYCMYLKVKYSVPAEKIKGRVEYLLTGTKRDVEITDESLLLSETEIKKSIGSMQKLLEDKKKNKSKSIKFFPLTKHRKFCPWCNFYEMCFGE